MAQSRGAEAVRALCAAAALCLALAAAAGGQVIKEPADPLDAAPAATTTAAPRSGPLVRDVRSQAHPDRPRQAGLGERISVEVQGLAAAVKELPNGCSDLILFLDGIPIAGSPPESCNQSAEAVRFLLDRTEDSDAAWHALLGSPDALTRTIWLSVGPAGNEAWSTRVHDFELEVLPRGEFLIYLALLAAALVGCVVLVRRTALLRDPHTVPPPGTLPPYSLSRFQLFFWTFLALAAYVFIWLITEELDTLTGSVLSMLGIGAGTALGASLIAQGKGEEPAGGTAAAGANAAAPATPTAAASAPAPAPTRVAASRGFLDDVLNGPQGMSLYRFQMLAWTLVLGVIFCVQVYNRLAMPDFSPSLLALMGISSATYLGAKFPEE
jgi:hypothetical protein